MTSLTLINSQPFPTENGRIDAKALFGRQSCLVSQRTDGKLQICAVDRDRRCIVQPGREYTVGTFHTGSLELQYLDSVTNESMCRRRLRERRVETYRSFVAALTETFEDVSVADHKTLWERRTSNNVKREIAEIKKLGMFKLRKN